MGAAHLLSGQQQVLVDVGPQEPCIAVAFHELENVLLQREEEAGEGVGPCGVEGGGIMVKPSNVLPAGGVAGDPGGG